MIMRRVTGPTSPRPCPPSSPATGWGGWTRARSPSTRPRRSCSLWRSSMSRCSTPCFTWSAVILIRLAELTLNSRVCMNRKWSQVNETELINYVQEAFHMESEKHQQLLDIATMKEVLLNCEIPSYLITFTIRFMYEDYIRIFCQHFFYTHCIPGTLLEV